MFNIVNISSYTVENVRYIIQKNKKTLFMLPKTVKGK